MSEYETIDAVWSGFAVAVTMPALYLTVVSSYLVVAYLAGAKLKTVQVLIISTLFVVFALWATWATVGFLAASRHLQLQQTNIPVYMTDIAPHQVMGPLQLIGIFASLWFMWDIRHSKSD